MTNLPDNSNRAVRTRFAPSPTGDIHIGNFRTALFAFLFARHNSGVNLLRIEDTDQNRFVQGAVENLLHVMENMGIEFDEGCLLDKSDATAHKVVQRGDHGPYVQSERLEIYHKYAQELIEKGSAYYCFCTTERLEELRKEQMALKKPAMYDRHCRNLPADEIKSKHAEFEAEGKRPVIRQAIPTEGQTTIHDLIYGDITIDHKILDDQVLVKSDQFPTYHLAVVVDDHLMEISHVFRGEEWISSTPKHILLYAAFGWEPTEFAHLPLILNTDKSKLSKRQGDVSVEDFLAAGYLKEALVNFVALLGWNPKTEQEIFSLQDLVREFDLANVNNAGAVFDRNKLDWINGLYIRARTDAEIVEAVLPFWKQAGIDAEKYSQDYLTAVVNLEKERLKKLSDIVEGTAYFFSRPEYDPALLVWKKSTAEQTRAVLQDLGDFFSGLDDAGFTRDQLEQKLKDFISQKGYDNGTVLWPLRVALTGLAKSPGPFEVASVLFSGLGKQEILERIKASFTALT
jgi:glutamyl-tRNA synthetase